MLTDSNGVHPLQLEPGDMVVLDNISVSYRVPRAGMGTLKEYLIRALQGQLAFNDFWALRNISFRLKEGEFVGIIGINGSGKSTLLKVISRVLRPTSGHVLLRGRVAPLLELGAGFHPDLTGRENIFLNGALLGFSRDEMKEKFDSIVEFSGLASFIEAPLRTYSSGMIARLGFTIATDINTNILLADEIFSVGDAEFIKKSKKRIQKFRKNSVSTILVSHMLSQVQSLCDRVIWLDHGRIVADGNPVEIVNAYKHKQISYKDK